MSRIRVLKPFATAHGSYRPGDVLGPELDTPGFEALLDAYERAGMVALEVDEAESDPVSAPPGDAAPEAPEDQASETATNEAAPGAPSGKKGARK